MFLDYIDKKYNAVLIDAYANQIYIPFHLTTVEFFKQVKEHLKSQGIVAMNINATADDSALLKGITNTVGENFNHVYLVKDENNFNYLLLASDEIIDFFGSSDLNIESQLSDLYSYCQINYQEVDYDKKYLIFTDDKAPVENLTDWMILDFLFKQS
jgi:hypothetical protein